MDNLIDQKVLLVDTWSVSPNQYAWGVAYPIQVRIKSGDTFSTKTSSAVGSIIGGSTITIPAVESIIGGSLSATGSHSPLSTGAIVGIALGTFFTIAFVVVGVLFFIYKLLQLRKRGNTPPVEPPIGHDVGKDQTVVAYEKAEMPVPGLESPVIHQELPDNAAKGQV